MELRVQLRSSDDDRHMIDSKRRKNHELGRAFVYGSKNGF